MDAAPPRPERKTEIGELTRGAFIINDFLRNPYFRKTEHLSRDTFVNFIPLGFERFLT